MDHFFEMMKSEWERLATYSVRPTQTWTLPYISTEDLAEAGFFYLLLDDRVQCAFCRGVVCGWEPGDKPLIEHGRHFPNCPFISGHDVGNIPIGDDPIRGSKPRFGYDVCGNYTPSQMNQISMNGINTIETQTQTHSLNMREFGVQPHCGPKNPNFASIDARKKSFAANGWNMSIPVSIDKLSEAGFFCIGVTDYVKCFYCDGGLCNWEENDDPWCEHAKWFPDCEYVHLNMGQEFIEEAKRKRIHEERENQMKSLTSQTVPKNRQSDDESVAIASGGMEKSLDVTGKDDFAIKVVDQWMRSDIVMQLIDMNSYPINIIRAALDKQWSTKQQPFESFEQLYNVVSQWRNTSLNEVPLRPNNYEQSLAISSDEESSKSSPSSASSSPPQSKLPELYLSDQKEDANRLICKICLDREIGVVFLPCGHQLACTQCAPCLNDCPVCRKQIKGTVRTFFS